LRNIQARAVMREILLRCAREKGEEYLSPYWTSRANSYFWERVEAGQQDYDEIVASFQRQLFKGQGDGA